MEKIETIGFIVFITALILNTITIPIVFKSLKRRIILDEVMLLMTILGMSFWAVASVLQKFEVNNYEGAVVISVAILINLVISRVSVLTGERKQILREILRANEVAKGE